MDGNIFLRSTIAIRSRLRGIEHRLRLTATRAFPIVGEILKRRARRDSMIGIADRGIVHLTADRTDIFARRLRRFDLADGDRLGHVVEIDDALRLEILIAQRSMRRDVHRRILFDELTDARKSVASRLPIFEHHRQPIVIQCLVGIGNIAVNDVIQPFALDDHDRIALGVTGREDVIYSVGDLRTVES